MLFLGHYCDIWLAVQWQQMEIILVILADLKQRESWSDLTVKKVKNICLFSVCKLVLAIVSIIVCQSFSRGLATSSK